MNDFFTPIFEFFHYSSPFSDDLYSQGLYSILGLAQVLGTLFWVLTFYYWINRPKFAYWYHWLIILLVNSLILMIASMTITQARFSALNLKYNTGDYFIFGLKSALMAASFFFVFSMAFRWGSTNAKTTPYPH
jgi:hypothetical protein